METDERMDADRPGVPRERAPRPAGEAYQPPTLQDRTVPVLTHTERAEVTPVFGSASPPRGLSGWMRKQAYRIPEHKAAHFMLLMVADRVDAVEHGMIPKLPLATAVLISGGIALRKLRNARSEPPTRRALVLRRLKKRQDARHHGS